MKYFADILDQLDVLESSGMSNVFVGGIQFNSLDVRRDDVFVAVIGTQTDGHRYIESAIKNGAVAIVGEVKPADFPDTVAWVKVKDSAEALGIMAADFYGHPSQKLKLVGVTGTNGKTTTVTLLHQLFSGLGQKAGLLSTIENKIGDQVVPSTHTTPDAVSIQALLKEMVDAGCTVAFMEVSSHAIDQKRIAGLHFSGGVFTNLTSEHLDYHKTMLNYLNVKKRFFDQLPKTAFALANIDDKRGLVMQQNTAARKVTYALKNMADYRANIQSNSIDGLQLAINGVEVYTRLIGAFNAYNALTAFAVANLLGVSGDDALRVLSGLPGAAGRFEKVTDPYHGRLGIIDYAHTPDALDKVLNTVNAIKNKNQKLFTVVGCGGDRDKTKRPIMGNMAAKESDQAVFTADNPRSENPSDIISEMYEGVQDEYQPRVLEILDRQAAIKTACRLAKPNGIILIAGKGHEKYQIINGDKVPFDDKAILLTEFNHN